MELQGLHDFQAFVGRVARLNERALLDDLGLAMLTRTLENFETERDPDGQAWAPLKASTLRQRGPGKILQDSRRMISGIHARQSAGRVEVGATAAYAPFHIEGTVHMEARVFLGFGPDAEDELGAVVTRHLEELVA